MRLCNEAYCGGFSRPFRDLTELWLRPGIEMPGYFQKSLRDLRPQRMLSYQSDQPTALQGIPESVKLTPLRAAVSSLPHPADGNRPQQRGVPTKLPQGYL